MARIRIRRLCSVVLFITGKENICFFYERQKHRLSLCYFVVDVSVNLESTVKLSFSQILFQSNSCFLVVNLL